MKKIVAAILVMALVAAITLAAVIVLGAASIRISQIPNPVVRAAAIAAELFTGIVWLLAAVYVATHLTVRIFRRAPEVKSPRTNSG